MVSRVTIGAKWGAAILVSIDVRKARTSASQLEHDVVEEKGGNH